VSVVDGLPSQTPKRMMWRAVMEAFADIYVFLSVVQLPLASSHDGTLFTLHALA
jgi:hypothetical protein